MNYKFGVYGDSIAFGYGNNNQSWFDELYLGNEALKLAQNGEKINPDLRVYLGASKNKEAFYEKYGFLRRPNEFVGAGMILRQDFK